MNRLTHARVWSALDALARRYSLSASGLAKRAGLDPTSFNKSKRVTGEGRPRWPTTESIAKVLEATGATFEDFTQLVTAAAREAGPAHPADRPHPGGSRRLLGRWRLSRRSRLGSDPLPQGRRRERLCSRGHRDSMQPLYRDGDILIVSPNSAPRKGDRVVLRTTDGEVMAKILMQRTAKTVELASFNPTHPNLVFPVDRIDWMARIVWAGQ
ncbi:MAG TPA: helix-turn-helix transcriptional regulator [Methyloceanibacter sp.]|nr:helix-turn-helix transcriptional regulator [Methyloceanibacter sp.]